MSTTADEWPHPARLRAGDAERQRAVEHLTAAWRGGLLTREEFQDRTQQALAATFTDEVDRLTADLGGASLAISEGVLGSTTGPGSAVARAAGADRLEPRSPERHGEVSRYAPPDARGSAVSVGFMSGMDKVGDWTVAPVHVSMAFWGGTTIDLRDAVFASADTTITCIAVMGGIEVIAPPEMEVRVAGIGVMGGFGWAKRTLARASGRAPGGPRVTINGLAFWAGVSITRKERDDPFD